LLLRRGHLGGSRRCSHGSGLTIFIGIIILSLAA